MNNTPKLSEERLRVIENIEKAIAEGDTFRKVELSDPVIGEEDVKRVILPFDNLRRGPIARVKALIARWLAEAMTKKFNKDTEIVGLENALSVKGGAIITANHYGITDSTPPRILAKACGKGKKFHIIVQQTNVFMKGLFGFLMKNCNTMPVSPSPSYMARNFTPALKRLLSEESFVLIYPEQEMWFNYKRPRPYRDGAFRFASTNGVPIIPTFTEMRECAGEYDENGFLRVKHILHIMPPIYPDPKLSHRENTEAMRQREYEARRALYESLYGESPDAPFDPRRHIAGYPEEAERQRENLNLQVTKST